MRARLVAVAAALAAVAACGAHTIVGNPGGSDVSGDPPLSGIWVPKPVYTCGVDTPCQFHLRLADSTVG